MKIILRLIFLQNSDLKVILDYCKTDTDKVLSYLTEEHKRFLKYRKYCNSLCDKHRSELKECNTIKVGKCTNLKVGQVLRNYRDNKRIIVYLGNDLFLSTSYFHLINMNFVLGGSALSYMTRVFDSKAITSLDSFLYPSLLTKPNRQGFLSKDFIFDSGLFFIYKG